MFRNLKKAKLFFFVIARDVLAILGEPGRTKFFPIIQRILFVPLDI